MQPAGRDAMQMPFWRPGLAWVPATSPMRTSAWRGNASGGKALRVIWRSSGKAMRSTRQLMLEGRGTGFCSWDPAITCLSGRLGWPCCSRHLRTWRPAACSTSVLSPALRPSGGDWSSAQRQFSRPKLSRHCWHAAPSSTSLCQEMACPIAISAIPASYQRSFPMQDWRYNTSARPRARLAGELAVSTHWRGQFERRGSNSYCTIVRSRFWYGLRSTFWS